MEGKGIHLRLKNIQEFLPLIGNPQKKFKSIIVGGTNGKGSVSMLLFNALKENKIKTGLYLSPHLFSFNERIQTNNGFISNKELIEEINFIYNKMIKHKAELSFFEFLTALAFHYFARKKVKVAILEVGLGGRLDATNAVKPIACAITSIDFDHQKFLGNSLKKIAKEKAGIIKKNSIVVSGEKRKKIQKIFERKAKKMNARIFLIKKDFEFKVLTFNLNSQSFSFKLKTKNKIIKIKKVKTKLVGFHQFYNASTALALLLLLKERLHLNEKKILNSFKKAFIQGRMQLLKRKPLILLDVAHNKAGIKALTKTIKALMPKKRFRIFFGCSADKEFKKMIKFLTIIASDFVFSAAKYRGQKPEKLLKALRAFSKIKAKILELKEAAKELKKTRKPTIITGSIYFASELLEEFKKTI